MPRVNCSSLAISAGARQAEVCPLVSHGRLDAGTLALADTADLDLVVSWIKAAQMGSDISFPPPRKVEIMALDLY